MSPPRPLRLEEASLAAALSLAAAFRRFFWYFFQALLVRMILQMRVRMVRRSRSAERMMAKARNQFSTSQDWRPLIFT